MNENIKTVAKISQSTANAIKDLKFGDNERFNPVQDNNGNWVISFQSAQYLDREEYYFSIINWVAPESTTEI